jgi:hypothetical protein
MSNKNSPYRQRRVEFIADDFALLKLSELPPGSRSKLINSMFKAFYKDAPVANSNPPLDPPIVHVNNVGRPIAPLPEPYKNRERQSSANDELEKLRAKRDEKPGVKELEKVVNPIKVCDSMTNPVATWNSLNGGQFEVKTKEQIRLDSIEATLARIESYLNIRPNA